MWFKKNPSEKYLFLTKLHRVEKKSIFFLNVSAVGGTALRGLLQFQPGLQDLMVFLRFGDFMVIWEVKSLQKSKGTTREGRQNVQKKNPGA